MAKYVDGYVIVVPKNKVKAYKKIASKAGKIWKKYGAIDYFETVGDDLNTKHGVPFTKLAKAKSSETVIFAFITYKNKKQRDTVNKKVMKDPFMTNFDPSDMPMDMKRFSSGGFKVLVEERRR